MNDPILPMKHKKRRAGLSGVQRTMAHLKGSGWTAAVVEVFVKPAGCAFGFKKDVLGLSDILAFSPVRPDRVSRLAFVQCCSQGGDVAKHKAKAEASIYLRPLLASGCRFVLFAWHPWAKDEQRDEFTAIEAHPTAQGGIAWCVADVEAAS